MNNFLNLYAQSTKLLRITVPDVPVGTMLEKAYLMIKSSWAEADESALVSLTITPGSSEDGQISNTGEDGTGVLEFLISVDALNGIEPSTTKTFYTAVKVILDNGSAYLLPNALIPTRIHPAGIEATE